MHRAENDEVAEEVEEEEEPDILPEEVEVLG